MTYDDFPHTSNRHKSHVFAPNSLRRVRKGCGKRPALLMWRGPFPSPRYSSSLGSLAHFSSTAFLAVSFFSSALIGEGSLWRQYGRIRCWSRPSPLRRTFRRPAQWPCLSDYRTAQPVPWRRGQSVRHSAELSRPIQRRLKQGTAGHARHRRPPCPGNPKKGTADRSDAAGRPACQRFSDAATRPWSGCMGARLDGQRDDLRRRAGARKSCRPRLLRATASVTAGTPDARRPWRMLCS